MLNRTQKQIIGWAFIAVGIMMVAVVVTNNREFTVFNDRKSSFHIVTFAECHPPLLPRPAPS